MTGVLAPAVRAQFAKRLRSLRAQRGYERARHFARSLGIEENRYTRYERAEVEPSLTLIYEICQKLAVTPNELLGFNDLEADRDRPAGLAEAPAGALQGLSDKGEGSAELRALAWQLATEAAQVQAERGRTKPSSDPLRLVRETSRIYSRLAQDPFRTVAEIVDDPLLQETNAERKVKLAALIEAYTAGMSE